MKHRHCAVVLLAFLCVAGCNRGKSPDQVAQDVQKAQQKADTETTRAQDSAQKDLNSAAEKVGDKLLALNNDAATDAYKIAVAKADGDLRIALAQCGSLAGGAQKSCKDQADADYQAAKANAKSAEVSRKE